ncbi:efflux transporter outer membrane subunit [Rhodanobacter sp. C06]|uniref:efflux transporter outer membrane subunit n=1 Tax=Rhodanobacter sp. C06 TaxID=1945854 RepID=UPI001C2B8B67|nr:efflux transporter outer membrane subunit [Rhodanobacter sp. C06]
MPMVAAMLLAACAVGPDFKAPAPPAVGGYTPHPVSTTTAAPGVTAGAAQHLASGADIPGDWWTLFHSAPLNALIEQALAHNHDLKAAQAALRVAHEDMLAQRGAFLPSVSANFSASHQRQAGSLAPVPNSNAFQYNLYTPQLSISYTPDVFGANRRASESLKAQEQAARFQMIATWNTLASNVAVAAIQLAALQAQVDTTRQSIAAGEKMLGILHYQYAKGYASRVDLAAQESQLAQTRATLPPLEKQLAQQHDQLAVLTGRFPSQAADDRITLDGLQLPAELPLSLPSALVQQRPDVRQAQANLHAASAQIGVATAARLPNITLSADTGSTALEFSKLFTGGTGFWDVAGTLTAPIFEGGTLLHQQRAAKAAYAEAAEQYRSTVLNAFQNVADTLVELDQDANALQAAAKAEQAAKLTLDLTQRQLKDGYASQLQWLTAEQTWQQARIALVQAQANRFADTVALYQALGGGWWHHSELSKQ